MHNLFFILIEEVKPYDIDMPVNLSNMPTLNFKASITLYLGIHVVWHFLSVFNSKMYALDNPVDMIRILNSHIIIKYLQFTVTYKFFVALLPYPLPV
jgi:hypothetical protein